MKKCVLKNLKNGHIWPRTKKNATFQSFQCFSNEYAMLEIIAFIKNVFFQWNIANWSMINDALIFTIKSSSRMVEKWIISSLLFALFCLIISHLI